MSPLSVLTFYLRNKRKLAPVLAVLALAVFGISLTGAMTGTVRDAGTFRVELYRRVTQVAPSYSSEAMTLDVTVEAELRRNPHIEALFPAIRLSTYFPTLMGGEGTFIYAVDQNVYPILMRHAELELAAGRLPRPGTAEIAVHEMVIEGRGLKIGDSFDPTKDPKEALPVKFKIVGVLSGPVVVSLASRDYVERHPEFSTFRRSLLLFARPGQESALYADLDKLDPDQIEVSSFPTELAHFNDTFGPMDTVVWWINSAVVFVLSLLVGLLNMIYFLDRMKEFGLLLGIGYSRLFVIRRVLVESLLLTALAWGLGILFSQSVYSLLNQLLFEPRGVSLSMLNWRAIQFTLPVPIIVGIFAVSTVLWQLHKLDPISIIDKRD